MENIFFFSIGTSLWLGILTSISPCPLAANITAVSYIGKNINSSYRSIAAGIFYAAGRMIAYMGISGVVTASIVSVPALSMFLQTKINVIMGPVLVITGIVLLGVLRINIGNNRYAEYGEKLAQKGQLWGSMLIGFLFALAFCPVSAALFFGSMLPLSLKHQSWLIIPSAYGLGTALPVIILAFLIAAGTHYVAGIFQKITLFEKWARKITGAVFILAGIYFSLSYIFDIQFF